jgi:predicted flap endonuclease-1-like 5' DNA nuclease
MLDARMGAFSGRIARDRLVEQACYLERGDTDGFEAVFGKLGGA